MNRLDQLYLRMVEYYAGDPGRIQHFVKVHSFAALIGRGERMSPDALQTLEAAAYVHDIGIKPAEEKYGRGDGPYQEELGQAPARAMMTECGFDEDTTERVVYLVGHHHTYTNIDGLDYQILVEADFLVNLFEGKESREAALHVLDRIFKTETGIRLCRTMFGV